MSENFKAGDMAYAYDSWYGVVKVMVINVTDNYVRVRFEHIVDRNGEKHEGHCAKGSVIRFVCPERGREKYGVWHTIEEAYSVFDSLNKRTEREYYKQSGVQGENQ